MNFDSPFQKKLLNAWKKNDSMICVGLDGDIQKIPQHLKSEQYPLFTFNKEIIDATADLVCSYKPQIAYYAAYGLEKELEMTIDYVTKKYPDLLLILDAKRSDIADSADLYAKEAFLRYKADAVTVNPYLGGDTLQSFIKYREKGVVILCKTSNPGSSEFQDKIFEHATLYEHVAMRCEKDWNKDGNCMLVVGATYPEQMKRVREFAPHVPFLVPGVGKQGGDCKEVIRNGSFKSGYGVVINSSRAIIYAASDSTFAAQARVQTELLKKQIDEARHSLDHSA